jgi:chromosome partitioning protein
LGQLPAIAQRLGIKLYPQIRSSNEFKNASAFGLPLHKYRPKHPACKDFKLIVDDVIALIKEKY